MDANLLNPQSLMQAQHIGHAVVEEVSRCADRQVVEPAHERALQHHVLAARQRQRAGGEERQVDVDGAEQPAGYVPPSA